MNILAFEQKPTLFAGGQERSLHEVMTGLRSRGVSLALCYAEPGELLEDYRWICDSVFRVSVRILNLRRLPSIIWSWSKLSLRALRRPHWDVIYTNQYFDLPLAALLGSLFRIPVICHLRLPAPHYLSRQFRWGLSRCACLIANSAYTKKTYLDAGLSESRFRVVFNSIDSSYFVPGAEPVSPERETMPLRRILYLGRLTPEKGIETLLDAFTLVSQVRPNVELRIVGNVRGDGKTPANYFEQLEQRARSGSGQSVVFLPHIGDVRAELRNADLLVLPSVWAEPFGRVLIESMACGVPVVASRVGGIPEVLAPEFEEMLVNPNDSTELADAILRLVDWRTDRPELGSLCRNHVVTKFDRTRMLDELMAIFVQTANHGV